MMDIAVKNVYKAYGDKKVLNESASRKDGCRYSQ